jgi:hypothetical protein
MTWITQTKSKTMYKKRQGGGRFGGDLTRGLVGGIRYGYKRVPYGNQVMELVDPMLDEGLDDVGKWERSERGFESTKSYKDYKNLLDPEGIKARQEAGRKKWEESQRSKPK